MKRTMIVCAALSLLAAGQTLANVVWNPAGNGIYPPDVGNWNVASNWTNATLPTDDGGKAVFNVDNAAECQVTDFQDNFQLVQGDNGTGGVIRIMSGGELTTVANWGAVSYNGPAARMIVETGGVMNFGGHAWIGFLPGGDGTVDIYGGTVNVAGQLGLGWNGGAGFINVGDGGLLALDHVAYPQSISDDSSLNIIGTGQVTLPGNWTNVVADFVADGKILGNGFVGDVIIAMTTNEPAQTVVTAVPIIPDDPLVLKVQGHGDTLDFAWGNQARKRVDLLSSQDITTDPNTWAPYNDGVNTYAGIPNSGTGTNTLTGVLAVGGPRLFALSSVPGGSIGFFAEDFDTGSGLPVGWTSGANAGDTGSTSWQVDAPSVVGPAEANSLSNCAATGIAANYGANVDIWLRTPEIDLTGATTATLVYQQAVDIEPIADMGSIRVLRASDGVQLGADVLSPVAGGGAGVWGEVEVDLPPEAFGEWVKIEFQFEADAANAAFWNGSFESPALDLNDDIDADGPTWFRGRYDGTGTNWFNNIDLTAKIWRPDDENGFSSVPDGLNVGVVTAKYDFDTAIRQSLPINLEANTQYDVSFQVGSPYDNGDGSLGKPIPDYRVELVAGGMVVASVTGASPSSFVNQWAGHNLNYSSGASPAQLGEPLELRLVAVAKGTSTEDLDGVHGQRLAYDALTLTVSPDPGSIGLAGWYIDDVTLTAPIP